MDHYNFENFIKINDSSFSSTSTFICIHDGEKICYINQAAINFYGKIKKGDYIKRIVPVEKRDIIYDLINRTTTSKIIIDMPFFLYRNDEKIEGLLNSSLLEFEKRYIFITFKQNAIEQEKRITILSQMLVPFLRELQCRILEILTANICTRKQFARILKVKEQVINQNIYRLCKKFGIDTKDSDKKLYELQKYAKAVDWGNISYETELCSETLTEIYNFEDKRVL